MFNKIKKIKKEVKREVTPMINMAKEVDRITAMDKKLTKMPDTKDKWVLKTILAERKYSLLSTIYEWAVKHDSPMYSRKAFLERLEMEGEYIMRLKAYGLNMAPNMDI